MLKIHPFAPPWSCRLETTYMESPISSMMPWDWDDGRYIYRIHGFLDSVDVLWVFMVGKYISRRFFNTIWIVWVSRFYYGSSMLKGIP